MEGGIGAGVGGPPPLKAKGDWPSRFPGGLYLITTYLIPDRETASAMPTCVVSLQIIQEIETISIISPIQQNPSIATEWSLTCV
jgi:hypothetical protein